MANLCGRALDARVDAGLGKVPALVFAGKGPSGPLDLREITYSDLREQVARVAGGLRALGVRKGDPVAIYMSKRPELYMTLLAAVRIGAIALPVLDLYRREAIQHRLADSGAVALVTESALLSQVPFRTLPNLKTVVLADGAGVDAPVRTSPFSTLASADPADVEDVPDTHPLILHYTAGAMGKPKGILHVHRIAAGLLATSKDVLGLSERTRVWCTGHPGWILGSAYSVFGPLLAGATSVVNTGPFDASVWARVLREARVEVWYTVPSALHRLREEGPAAAICSGGESLRTMMTTAERLSASLAIWVRETLGIEVRDSWWMTETGMICIAQSAGVQVKPGSLGMPVAGVEAAALDPTGRVLPPNQVGLLALRKGWPGMMASVWKDERGGDAYWNGEWFVSGDYVYADDDGHFFFQGRTEETIKVLSERINPFEVEDALLTHPAVAEVAVIGKTTPDGRETIKAFVVLVAGFEASAALTESLRSHVGQNLSPLSRPEDVEYLPALPKTRLGKVLRRVLKAREAGMPLGDTSTMADGKVGP